MIKMNGGVLPPGSWPDSPSKPNTNPEPHDETLRPIGLEKDGPKSQDLREDIQKKEHKIAMLPPEIIER